MTSLNAPETALSSGLSAARSAASALSFIDVSKHFATTDGRLLEVLRRVSFGLPAGAIVAILGPSGAGKSTLLNLAAGLIRPDGGRVEGLGADTTGAVDWGRGGYMFPDDRLLPRRFAPGNVTPGLPAAARARP